eukprot:CAMPEP_0180686366 /NCGR_PEP_ID=MMETSP1037_2-20121125/72894_1 /TAXON_ID=632150 /ORGANISM="Azadinium spinosum, Strain 3D9" /LENGTH=74 /DNA_ID=CAMNT_0022717105 /DNA_START=246 /DNA_END=466 /DNA_ORIENTATION=-
MSAATAPAFTSWLASSFWSTSSRKPCPSSPATTVSALNKALRVHGRAVRALLFDNSIRELHQQASAPHFLPELL